MKKINRVCLPLLITIVLLSGCAGNESNNNEDDLMKNTNDVASSDGVGTDLSDTGDTPSFKDSLNVEDDSANIAFESQDMDGNTVSSDIFSQSKLTMVNVWATYCNPCLNEMPGLGELAAAYNSDEFQIIGVVSDVQEGASSEMTDLAADLIEQTGADYTHLLLNESLYYALLTDVSAVPTTFFINEDGVILDTVVGAMGKDDWEEKINALLEEQ